MRVCFFSSYPPNKARLSEYGKYLVKELDKSPKIDKIYVMADVVDGRKNRVWETPKVEVIRNWKPDNPLSILALVPKILKLKPDVVHLNVHCQSFGRSRITNFTGLSLALLLRLLRLKVVVTIHNLGDKVDLAKVNVKPNILNRVGINLATRAILTANTVVVTVNSYVEHLKRNYRYDRSIYIRHGTTLKRSDVHESIDPPEKRILIFGHMAPHKSLPLMLEAFKKLLEERTDVKLIVAGSSHPNFPGYIEKFRDAHVPNVEFPGYIQEENLEDLFTSADMVVLPYLTATGTSGVFHMACGFGKPIVASDLPEINELLAEGASAILVPPGNASALKKAIKNLLEDPRKCLEISQKNLAYASKETWDRIAEEYEEVYLELYKV